MLSSRVKTTPYSMLTAWMLGVGIFPSGPRETMMICSDCVEKVLRSMPWPPSPR